MTSAKKPDRPLLDLERDLPVTPEDVAAQRRLRHPKVDDYLAALSRLPAPSPEELAARRGPRGEPFEL
jgi:hypothetical protein